MKIESNIDLTDSRTRAKTFHDEDKYLGPVVYVTVGGRISPVSRTIAIDLHPLVGPYMNTARAGSRSVTFYDGRIPVRTRFTDVGVNVDGLHPIGTAQGVPEGPATFDTSTPLGKALDKIWSGLPVGYYITNGAQVMINHFNTDLSAETEFGANPNDTWSDYPKRGFRDLSTDFRYNAGSMLYTADGNLDMASVYRSLPIDAGVYDIESSLTNSGMHSTPNGHRVRIGDNVHELLITQRPGALDDRSGARVLVSDTAFLTHEVPLFTHVEGVSSAASPFPDLNTFGVPYRTGNAGVTDAIGMSHFFGVPTTSSYGSATRLATFVASDFYVSRMVEGATGAAFGKAKPLSRVYPRGVSGARGKAEKLGRTHGDTFGTLDSDNLTVMYGGFNDDSGTIPPTHSVINLNMTSAFGSLGLFNRSPYSNIWVDLWSFGYRIPVLGYNENDDVQNVGVHFNVFRHARSGNSGFWVCALTIRPLSSPTGGIVRTLAGGTNLQKFDAAICLTSNNFRNTMSTWTNANVNRADQNRHLLVATGTPSEDWITFWNRVADVMGVLLVDVASGRNVVTNPSYTTSGMTSIRTHGVLNEPDTRSVPPITTLRVSSSTGHSTQGSTNSNMNWPSFLVTYGGMPWVTPVGYVKETHTHDNNDGVYRAEMNFFKIRR